MEYCLPRPYCRPLPAPEDPCFDEIDDGVVTVAIERFDRSRAPMMSGGHESPACRGLKSISQTMLLTATGFNRLQDLLTFAYAEVACEQPLIRKT